MELKNADFEYICDEIEHSVNVREFMLEFTSNPEGDQYKITVNGEDMTKNWDLYLQIYQLVEEEITLNNKIITELMIVKRPDGTIKADVVYYEGNINDISRYNPFE